METVIVTLKNAKAKKLLQDLEEMDLIEIREKPASSNTNASFKISDLAGMIKSPMSEEEINKQIEELRNEWERNF